MSDDINPDDTHNVIGLGIETHTKEVNSWSEAISSPSKHAPKHSSSLDNEDYIKPIRLAKRHENHENRLSTSSVSTTSSVSSHGAHSPRSNRRLLSGMSAPSKPEEFQFRPIRLGNAQREKRFSYSNEKEREADKEKRRSNITIDSKSDRERTAEKPIQIKNLPISPIVNDNNVSATEDMIFAIGLVDFHHLRGPEVQWWKSNYHPEYTAQIFKNLPFQALPDGSHLFEETFSNFNLVYDFKSNTSIDDLHDLNIFQGDPRNLKTVFGCSCVRQVKTSDLSQEERDRNKDITRSIVQKAVVIISRKQPIFTKIKEKLSIITKSYFQQDNFTNFELLENLFENLNTNFKLVDDIEEVEKTDKAKEEEEFFINLNLKNSILKFKSSFLVIFKALLLDKKILIFSNNNLEMLTQFQNNLISLIPNLINNLNNSGCPLIDYIETNGPLSKPSSLNTNNRKSMLRFFGLPLQIFNTKNSFWNPYLPLQQLDELSVKSYMIGCSNLLFVNQAEKFAVDLVINLDTNEVTFPCGKVEDLALSHYDKKFIHNLVANISTLNDEFIGNDDYIRYQFEDYLTSLISTMRYSQYVEKFHQPPPGFSDKDTSSDISFFNKRFIESWKLTNNFKIWHTMADEFIFNFIDPKHLGIDLPDESQAYKNISNFFNGFKFKGPNLDVDSKNDPIKSHRFIENEDDNDKKDTSRDSTTDGLPSSNSPTRDPVASFPMTKLSPLAHKSNSDSDPISEEVEGFENVSNTPQQAANAKKASWTSGWGFKKK